MDPLLTLDSQQNSAEDSGFADLLRQIAKLDSEHELSSTHSLSVDDTTFAMTALARLPPKPGDVLDGRYEITSVIGEGGMGVVLAARNLRTSRDVAIKYIHHPERVTARERRIRVERFVREALLSGRIRHPNVVDLFDAGGDADAPYLVMERLVGESLRTRLQRGPLSESEALFVVSEAARGVAEAHRLGVVHRDLKPDNIFLATGEHGELRVKVLDFGVSRLHKGEQPLDTLTRSGTLIGTPAYMPIEQLRGEREVDARADVYALGVILYEALSGRRPYDARNLHDFVLRMATEEARPLSQVAPTVSRHVQRVVHKALARDRKARFADAHEFVQALCAADDSPSLKTRARLQIGSAIALCALLAIGLGLGLGKPAENATAVHRESPARTTAQVVTQSTPRTSIVAPEDPQLTAMTQAVQSEPPIAQSPKEPRRPAVPRRIPSVARARANTASVPTGERARQLRPEDF